MTKVKVTLSIGYPGADQEEVIDIDDDEWASCKTSEQKQEFLEKEAQEWANHFIEVWSEVIEEQSAPRHEHNNN